MIFLDKHIFVINGSGGVGKDTFVKLVSEELNKIMKKLHTVTNFSSVDKVKELAKEIGWKGEKSERDRKFMFDLKILASDYSDMPFQSMKEKVRIFKMDMENQILFLHIREPKEIKRAVHEFGAKTILVKRDSIKQIISNTADQNVFHYTYDFIIENNGTIEELREKAKKFVQEAIY